MRAHDWSSDDEAGRNEHPKELPGEEKRRGEEKGERSQEDPAATEEKDGREPPTVAEHPHHGRDGANGREVSPGQERERARRDVCDTRDGAAGAAMTITGRVLKRPADRLHDDSAERCETSSGGRASMAAASSRMSHG